MLEEYALTPDVFSQAKYSKPDFIEMCIPNLKDVILVDCALVRDLGDGAWSAYCTGAESTHRLGKELLRKLKSNNRLRRFPRTLASELVEPEDWCREALATHASSPLSGIIASHGIRSQFPFREVASVEKLAGADWWQERRSTATPARQTEAYLRELERLFSQVNSVMFIDPNLDPSQHNYREFYQLLAPLARRESKPLIEIHRSFCLGDGQHRTFPRESEWRERFDPLSQELIRVGLSARVFFWTDFHWRYLITDVAGFVTESGFDITGQANARTQWARMDRRARDSIQREYDPAFRPAEKKWDFAIGASAP